MDRFAAATRDHANRSRFSRRDERSLWRRRFFGAIGLVRTQIDFLDLLRIEQTREHRGLTAGEPLSALAGGDGIRKMDGDCAGDGVLLAAFRTADQGHAGILRVKFNPERSEGSMCASSASRCEPCPLAALGVSLIGVTLPV